MFIKDPQVWWGCGGRKQRRANFNTGAKFIYIYTHTTYKHTYMYAYISRWILTKNADV